MKQITFGTEPTKKNQTVNTFMTAVIDFLVQYGCTQEWAEHTVKIVDERVTLSPSCSNGKYTKALAILQLCFWDIKGLGDGIFYKAGVMQFNITNYSEAIDTLNAHLNCTII